MTWADFEASPTRERVRPCPGHDCGGTGASGSRPSATTRRRGRAPRQASQVTGCDLRLRCRGRVRGRSRSRDRGRASGPRSIRCEECRGATCRTCRENRRDDGDGHQHVKDLGARLLFHLGLRSGPELETRRVRPVRPDADERAPPYCDARPLDVPGNPRSVRCESVRSGQPGAMPSRAGRPSMLTELVDSQYSLIPASPLRSAHSAISVRCARKSMRGTP